jgi:hypothetical protein
VPGRDASVLAFMDKYIEYATMDVIEIQSLLQGLGVVSNASGMDLSHIVECLCNCALSDDELGLAEWSRLLSWLLGNVPSSLH